MDRESGGTGNYDMWTKVSLKNSPVILSMLFKDRLYAYEMQRY